MNPDLPQFEEGINGWSEITLAYDLAPYVFAIPVAIQVLSETARVIATGILTGTEDQFTPTSVDNDTPLKSIFYFKDAEPLEIEWRKTRVILAMVSLPPKEDSKQDTPLT